MIIDLLLLLVICSRCENVVSIRKTICASRRRFGLAVVWHRRYVSAGNAHHIFTRAYLNIIYFEIGNNYPPPSRQFNRGRPQQRRGGGQQQQQNGAASSSRNIFNRLTDPIFRGGAAGGRNNANNNNARRQLDYRKNAQTMASSSTSQTKGPMLHMIKVSVLRMIDHRSS